MADVFGNLLEEPLLGVELAGSRRESVSLPGVLALLGGDSLRAFTALQLHQAHAWHAFLVQLAAMALPDGEDPAGLDAKSWADRLRAMTGGQDEAWCLSVQGLAQPAFFQPPVPEGHLKNFESFATPDGLEVLITSKNHDVKALRLARAKPEHWVYALLMLQTMQGFLGRGNYGIARMNGGFASRPGVGFAPGLEPGARFRRDLSAVRAHRGETLQVHSFAPERGAQLLWVLPWDGTTSLAFSELDPSFIEICRRVRLTGWDSNLRAHVGNSAVARVAGKELAGMTGDPWTPINAAEQKALTVSARGFDYRLVQQLLFSGDFRPGSALTFLPSDGASVELHASVLVRGQGKTEGLHQRRVPVPKPVRLRIQNPDQRRLLAEQAQARVELASLAQQKVLKPALLALLQGGPKEINFKDERPAPRLQRFDAAIDACFFDALFEDLELPVEEGQYRWAARLEALARIELDDALEHAPTPTVRRYRGQAAAESLFFFNARKHLPQAPAAEVAP